MSGQPAVPSHTIDELRGSHLLIYSPLPQSSPLGVTHCTLFLMAGHLQLSDYILDRTHNVLSREGVTNSHVYNNNRAQRVYTSVSQH